VARDWSRPVLVAVITCPKSTCGVAFEGDWEEPEDPMDEAPEDCIQLCPDCGNTFTASWPGYSFHTEAGLSVAVPRNQSTTNGRHR